MKRMNLLTIWVKRAIPALALAAGLMSGCNKPDDVEDDVEADPYAEPIDPVKVLKFGDNDIGYDSIGYNNVMKYANDPRITKIIYFLDSTNNNYISCSSDLISFLRKVLQECLDYTPKATGAGTFIFGRSKLTSQDSLWFVQNGWEVRTR